MKTMRLLNKKPPGCTQRQQPPFRPQGPLPYYSSLTCYFFSDDKASKRDFEAKSFVTPFTNPLRNQRIFIQYFTPCMQRIRRAMPFLLKRKRYMKNASTL